MSRATSMTMMNARSSRSHAVFSLTLEQRRTVVVEETEDGEGGEDKVDGADLSYLCAKMLLVDLAGSERAKRTQATGARLQEGIHINQGALTLSRKGLSCEIVANVPVCVILMVQMVDVTSRDAVVAMRLVVAKSPE
jgi:hypothetical protein